MNPESTGRNHYRLRAVSFGKLRVSSSVSFSFLLCALPWYQLASNNNKKYLFPDPQSGQCDSLACACARHYCAYVTLVNISNTGTVTTVVETPMCESRYTCLACLVCSGMQLTLKKFKILQSHDLVLCPQIQKSNLFVSKSF